MQEQKDETGTCLEVKSHRIDMEEECQPEERSNIKMDWNEQMCRDPDEMNRSGET